MSRPLPAFASRRLRRDLLATTALAFGLGLPLGDRALAQSYAAGQNATAGGANATAVGPNASATGDRSFAGGYNASAPGADSVAIGSGASALSGAGVQGIIDHRGGTGGVTPPQETSAAGPTPSGTAIGAKSTVGSGGGVAIGYNNAAGTGNYSSTAIGTNNNGIGAYSVSLGNANISSNTSTVAIGTANQATGYGAIALGRETYVTGDNAIGQGFLASAYGPNAIAFGYLSRAGAADGSQASNIALGDNTQATGGSATALGSGASATNAKSVAVGAGSMALRGTISGTEAFSGASLSAANTEFSVGSAGSERQITNVAGGTQNTDAVNVRQLRSLGNTLGSSLGGSFDPTTNAYTAPSYAYGGQSYATVPALANALDTFALRYDRDGSGNRLASIDLTRGGTIGNGSGVSITGLAPATTDSGAVALSQMPVRYSTAANPTTANPAVPSNDVTLVGSAAGPVALHNVKSGDASSAASTDAVNGGQLYTTNQNVAALQSGTAGLVQQSNGTAPITVGRSTGGTLVDLTNAQNGTRRLAGLSAGIADSDAATLGQLRLSSNALGGGAGYDPTTGAYTAPSYTIGGQTYRDVGSALTATNALGVQYVADGAGNPTAVVDLAKGGATPVALRGVAAGAVAASSTDAVNGGQLYTTNQDVAALQNGTSGLVRQASGSSPITVGAASGGTRVDLTNNVGDARVLTGVAAGTVAQGSTDAVNGGQLNDVSQRVANNYNAVANGTVGLVQQDPASRTISVGATTDGRLVDLTGSAGTRRLAGLSSGIADTDAATVGQMRLGNGFLTSSLGGGAAYDPSTGASTAPTYTVGGQAYRDVGSALTATNALGVQYVADGAGNPTGVVDLAKGGATPVALRGVAAGAVASGSTDAVNGGQLYTVSQSVANNYNAVANGTVGLVQQDPASRTISVGANTDGRLVDLTGSAGTRRLAGLSSGIADTDAATVGQLRLGNGFVTSSLGGGAAYDPSTGASTAPSYTVGGQAYRDVGSALAATNALGVQYVADGAGNPTGVVDLAKGGATPVALRGVAAGAVAAGSTDAVNGGQLYTVSQSVANNYNALANGTAGLVQQDPASRTITVGATTDGRLVDLTGSAGTRRLAGLSAGIADTDAATVGQMRLGNGFVTSALGGGAVYDPATGAFTAPSYTVGGQTYRDVASAFTATNALGVQYVADGAGNPTAVVDLAKGGATPVALRGVAAGVVAASSTDAVNGGQLYTVGQSIAALQNGTSGLVRQDATTRAIAIGGGTDGTTIGFADQSGTARTLTGIAAGQIAAGSAQGVNGGQVYAVTASLASALGGGAGVAADGTLTAPSYAIQGSTFSTVGGALGSLDAAVASLNTNGSRYVAVNTTGAAAQASGLDTVAIGPAAIAAADRGVALGAGAVASRAGLSGASEAFSGTFVASTQGAISVGDVGAERQITNVAGGTQDTDAVNVRQLRAVGGNLAGALGGGAGFAADGSFTAPSYAVAGRQYASVGAALGAVDTYGVKYDVDPASGGRGQSITLAGGDPSQPVLIRRVAAGILPTDAANVGQVAQARTDAFAYTDRSIAASSAAGTAYTDAAVAPLQSQMTAFGNQLSDLTRQVGEVRSEARRAAAVGLAAASLRFDDRPGKISLAAGGGVWRGEAAASFGVGYTLPDGWAKINATGVAAGRDFGIGAGASFTLN